MPNTLPLLVGFSIGMALLLALALATAYRQLELPWQSRVAGFVMLLGLALTQLGNLDLLQTTADHTPTRTYLVVLFLQSLGFYWLALGVLRPADRWHRAEWYLPAGVLMLAVLVPASLGIAVALGLGAGFSAHLGLLLFRLRAQRRWFRLEMPVLAMFGLMGVALAIVGLLTPLLSGWAIFAWTYAACIAVGFLLVGWLLLAVPDLALKTSEAVQRSYTQSTLGKINQESALVKLRRLFEVDGIYRDEALNLAAVAELMELSAHQLSELINSRLDLGFSRLVRRYRVAAAQRMLVDEPRASVLSIGLAVGFSSQSSFYLAFKEELGMVPGQYRKSALQERAGAPGPTPRRAAQ